jgi:hypothetical protein
VVCVRVFILWIFRVPRVTNMVVRFQVAGN